MEIRAYSLAQEHSCANPLSVLAGSPAMSREPVAGSYHCASNCVAAAPWSLTVFGWPELPFICATITRSGDCPLPNHWDSLLPAPSTVRVNGRTAESSRSILAVIECVRKLFTAHTW